MILQIKWTDKLKVPNSDKFISFCQKMANRIIQGHARYGLPNSSKKYCDRLEMEVKAYCKSGNAEHLINAANYCWLEIMAPQHSRHHFEPINKSITRRLGEEIRIITE